MSSAERPLPAPLCDEDYPPLDGWRQDRTYGRRLGLSAALGFWRKALRRRGPGLGLYLHWPFCAERCSYCYCGCRVPAGEKEVERALLGLEREMVAFSPVFRGSAFSAAAVCGGTPTRASVPQLERLLGGLRARFSLNRGADFGMEASPATLDAARLAVLLKHGVGRVDLGVDSMDPAVLKRTGRRQTRAQAEAACRLARRAGLRLEVGLMMGLEGQSTASFLRDVLLALRQRPACLRLYAFEPRPQTAFALSGKHVGAARRAEMSTALALAGRVALRAGYRSPDTGWGRPLSILGLGPSASSHAFGGGWYSTRASGAGCVYEGAPLTLLDEMRRCLISGLFCRGRVSVSDFRRLFGKDMLNAGAVGKTVKRLLAEGKLEKTKGALSLNADDPIQRQETIRQLYGEDIRKLLRKRMSASQESKPTTPRPMDPPTAQVFIR